MSTVERVGEAVRLTGVSAYGVRFTDLVLRYGEVVVLTGPNGAGKSTLSRLVVGELTATGSVEVLGGDPVTGDLTGRIGYLVKDLETMGSLTSRDVLDICAAVRGCGTAYAHQLAARIGLEIDRPMGQLSRGQLRRLGIVQALMHEPELIVLDDPMTELDDTARRVLPDMLREAAARGAAVLVTAQAESDADLCAGRAVQLRRVDAEEISGRSPMCWWRGDCGPAWTGPWALNTRRQLRESVDAGEMTGLPEADPTRGGQRPRDPPSSRRIPLRRAGPLRPGEQTQGEVVMGTGKQWTGELWVLMLVRRLGFGRNSLRRSSDRLETVLLWCALVAALVMVPVSAMIGTSISSSLEASAARQRAVLHETQAKTVEDNERSIPDTPGSAVSLTKVSYVDPQGIERQGLASVVIGTPAGARVTIWLDQSGKVVAAPRSRGDSQAFGATAGILSVFGSWLLLSGLFLLVRVPLNRRRLRDWDADWRTVAPRWIRGQK